MAVLIYGYILWVALGLLFEYAENDVPANRPLRGLGLAVTVAVCIMILSGGFVAGTKAGFAFNTFPLMNGQLIPEGVLAMKPVWSNFFENIATVQLDHRLIAYLLCIMLPFYWHRIRQAEVSARTRAVAHVLLATFGLQISLGVATLLFVVPVALAAAHQAGALLVFSVALFMNHELRASV
jgi:cytochrome c oxidase assembly protein subunit 15